MRHAVVAHLLTSYEVGRFQSSPLPTPQPTSSRRSSLRHWLLRTLGHAEPVARIVAEGRFDSPGALGRLGQEADTPRAERCVRRSTGVGLEGASSKGALSDECLHLLGCLLVHHGRARHDQHELVIRAKADREAHLGDRELRAPEKLLGALDPTTLEVSVWRFAERSFETAHEMRS